MATAAHQQQPSRPVWNAATLRSPMILNLEDSMVVAWRLLAECEFVSQVCLTLVDPISSARLKQPSRSFYCKHAQCFEYSSFVTTNRSKALSEYQCPICLAPSNPSKVYCDSLWLYLLGEFPATNQVILNRSGILQSYQNEGNHHEDNVIDLTGDDDDDDKPYLINRGSTHSSSAKIVDIKGLTSRPDLLHQLVRGLQQRLDLTDFKKLSSTNMWDLLHLVNSKDPLQEIIDAIPRSEKRLEKYFRELPEWKPYVCSSIDFLATEWKKKLKVSFKDAKLMIDKVASRQRAILLEVYRSFEQYRIDANAHWSSPSILVSDSVATSASAITDVSTEINSRNTTARAMPAPIMKSEVVANENNLSSTDQASLVTAAVSASSSSSSRNSTSSYNHQASQLLFQQESFSDYLQFRAEQSNPAPAQNRAASSSHAMYGNSYPLSNVYSPPPSSSSAQLNRSIPHIRQFHGTPVAAIAAPEQPLMTANAHVDTTTMSPAVHPEIARRSNDTSNSAFSQSRQPLSASAAAPALQESLTSPSSAMNNASPLILPLAPTIDQIPAAPMLVPTTPTSSSTRKRSHSQMMAESDEVPQMLNESGVSLSRPSLSRRIITASNSKTPNAAALLSQGQTVTSPSVLPTSQLPHLTAAALTSAMTPVSHKRADSAGSQSSDLKSISSSGIHTQTDALLSQAISQPMVEDTTVTSPIIEAQQGIQQQPSSSSQPPPAENMQEQEMEEGGDILDSESDSSSIVFLDFVRADRPAEVGTTRLKTEAGVAIAAQTSYPERNPLVPTASGAIPAMQLPVFAELPSMASLHSAGSNRPYASNNKRQADVMESPSSSASSSPPPKAPRTEQQHQPQPLAKGLASQPQQQTPRQAEYMRINQPRFGAPRHPPPPNSQHQRCQANSSNSNVHTGNAAVRAQSNSQSPQSIQYGSVLQQQRGHRGPGRLKLFAPPRAEPMATFTDDDHISAASSQSTQAQPNRPIYVQRQRQTPPKAPTAQGAAQSSQENGPRTAHVRLMVNDFSE